MKQSTFETSDLNLASFLRCRHHQLTDIRRERDGRSTFVFLNTPALHRDLLDFVNDGDVAVRTFCGTLRDLKAMTRVVETGVEWDRA